MISFPSQQQPPSTQTPYHTTCGPIGIRLWMNLHVYIRLGVARSGDTEANTMGRPGHKSGKKGPVRHPGRRRFKPGRKPKAEKIKTDRVQSRLTAIMITNVQDPEKNDYKCPELLFEIDQTTECEFYICRWDRELPRIAFDGWKALHYGFKQWQQQQQ